MSRIREKLICSLQFSQHFAIGPYPEPNESSQHRPFLISVRFVLIMFPYLRLRQLSHSTLLAIRL